MAVLVDPLLDRWFTSSFLGRHSEMLDVIREQLLATCVEGYVGCSEAIRNLDTLDRLNEIDLSTLIIVGEEDPGTPVSAAQSMRERIAHSELVVLSLLPGTFRMWSNPKPSIGLSLDF